MNRARNPSGRELADRRPTNEPSQQPPAVPRWAFVSGALLSICGGSAAAIAGNVWSAPIVVGGLAALMHGQNPRGLDSVNLGFGRALYREHEESAARDGLTSDEEHEEADAGAPDGSASDWQPSRIDESSQENEESARVVPLRREVHSARRGSVAGVSPPRTSRPHETARIAEQEGRCPKCGRVALQLSEEGYYCEDCPLAFER